MRSIYIQVKLNKLGHENAVILFKVMDGGSEYCYWSVLDPVQAMLNHIQFCLFKSLFLVCMCRVYGMCVCVYMYIHECRVGGQRTTSLYFHLCMDPGESN